MRTGIHCAGNFLIDYIKIIDKWPQQGMLANIEDEAMGTGGGPYNVLINLAKMKVHFPLSATGIVGTDTTGKYILNDLKNHQINISSMETTSSKPTSYTVVMSEKYSGYRTFFHHRGTNVLLDYQHLANVDFNNRIFYLGYLLLLDMLEETEDECGVVAAKVLKHKKQRGLKTCVDMVSDDRKKYRQIVTPCLNYIDYLIINEIEAGNSTGQEIRCSNNTLNKKALESAAETLLKEGVNDMVVIHFPEGGFAATKKGMKKYIPSYYIQKEEIAGTTGAGDAFCAGMLYGIHENLSLEMSLKIAHANAHFNLLNPTSTGGAVSITTILDFIKNHPI